MMKNFDQSVEINHNPNWPYIPDHTHIVLIIGILGSGKTNMLLNLEKNSTIYNDFQKTCFKSTHFLKK